MAKLKPASVKAGQRRAKKTKPQSQKPFDPVYAQSLIDTATAHLQTGEAFAALRPAEDVVDYLCSYSTASPAARILPLPGYALLGEVNLELGEPLDAREAFLRAVALDPDGEVAEEEGGGADKFLWLAQLCENGGQESVDWFEKGAKVLRRDLATLQSSSTEEEIAMRTLKQQKLASALCGAAEVYMTDLSWETDAETQAATLAHSAVEVAPTSCEPLQTLASVQLSQTRLDEAQTSLRRSLDSWQHLPPEHEDIPEYATRISLSRLLMEAEMAEQAMDVLEGLVGEDDGSVEAWYLGGWCAMLLADKSSPGQFSDEKALTGEESKQDTKRAMLSTGRAWLARSLKLYDMLEYEDERVQEHARELVERVNGALGPIDEGAEEDAEAVEDWEDEDGEPVEENSADESSNMGPV